MLAPALLGMCVWERPRTHRPRAREKEAKGVPQDGLGGSGDRFDRTQRWVGAPGSVGPWDPGRWLCCREQHPQVTQRGGAAGIGAATIVGRAATMLSDGEMYSDYGSGVKRDQRSPPCALFPAITHGHAKNGVAEKPSRAHSPAIKSIGGCAGPSGGDKGALHKSTRKRSHSRRGATHPIKKR